MNTPNPPGFIGRLLIPLGIAAVSGFVCYQSDILNQIFSAGVTIPFTISKGILDGWALEVSKNIYKKSEHGIHKKYALSKIGHVRGVLSGNYSAKAQVHALGELEVILTDVWKCCSGSTKTTYKKQKGIVASYKNDLYVSSIDTNINKPNIQKFLTELQKIETTLRESDV